MGSRRKLINNNIAAGIIIHFSLFNIISYLFTPLITIQKKKKFNFNKILFKFV